MKTAIARIFVEPYEYIPTPLVPEGMPSEGAYTLWLNDAMGAVDAAENAKKRSRIDADFDRWCAENGVGT